MDKGRNCLRSVRTKIRVQFPIFGHGIRSPHQQTRTPAQHFSTRRHSTCTLVQRVCTPRHRIRTLHHGPRTLVQHSRTRRHGARCFLHGTRIPRHGSRTLLHGSCMLRNGIRTLRHGDNVVIHSRASRVSGQRDRVPDGPPDKIRTILASVPNRRNALRERSNKFQFSILRQRKKRVGQ